MKFWSKIMLIVLMMSAMSLDLKIQAEEMATFRTWAMTPPKGWNSWDCYYSSVTETEVVQNAEFMRDNLKQYGYEYVVVDIRWYCEHPSLGAGNYNQRGDQGYVLDEYGRYLPPPRRFPSCMDGDVNVGFKPLADRIHAMGLKFGIHIMRGVPTTVAKNPANYTLLGSGDATASERQATWAKVYNGTTSPCTWLKDNALVRMTDEGQQYYNSIINLYAQWGVDFIKVDDIARPFYTDEIQMIRNAIDQCGRPIVLSLSPGKTQYQYHDQCHALANQWRMMDDLWDNWNHVSAVFAEAAEWAKYHQVGNYADCDMLPIGQIAMTVADPGFASKDNGRWTHLTDNELYTMMTLWGICHSPLMIGGEMTSFGSTTMKLLTNEEMLRMNNCGVDAHQVSGSAGKYVWESTDPDDGSKWIALFSTDGDEQWVSPDNALYCSETVAYTTEGHKVDVECDIPEGTDILSLVVDDGGDNFNYDHGDWINPTVILSDNTEYPLTGADLDHTFTASYYNVVRENRNVTNTGSMKVMGTTYARGFATDANAVLYFKLPAGAVKFKGIGAADDSGIGQTGSTTSMRFMVFAGECRNSELLNGAIFNSGLVSRTSQKAGVEVDVDIAGAEQLKIVVDNYDGSFAYDRANFVNPVLVDENGQETSLTTLSQTSYTSSWGSLHKNTNVEGGTLKINGTSYSKGLGMNAACTLLYTLPAGHKYVRLKGLVGYDSSCDTDAPSGGNNCTMKFLIYATSTKTYVSADLTTLGYTADEEVSVKDCWSGETLESVKGTLSAEVGNHGARLLKISAPKSYTGIHAVDAVTTDATDATSAASGQGLYDMMGRKLGQEPKHGLYIKNGQKFFK